MLKPPSGTELTFRFFEDESGRLRFTILELGITKPAISRDGRRYKILKVLGGWYNWFSPEDVWKLQLAQAGDIVRVKVI